MLRTAPAQRIWAARSKSVEAYGPHGGPKLMNSIAWRALGALAVFLRLGAGLAHADTLLIKSTNGGRTWTDVDPGPPSQLLYLLRLDPRTSNLFAITGTHPGSEDLLVSVDGGQSWQPQFHLPANVGGVRAAVSPETLYLAYQEFGNTPGNVVSIAKVTDAGKVVEQYTAQGLTIETPPASLYSWYAALIDLAVDAANRDRLYALVTSEYADDISAFFQALWRSDDGGRNWSRLEPPVTANCSYPQIHLDPSGAPLYLLCDSDFLKSTDGGDSWTNKTPPISERVFNLLIGAGTPGILYTVRAHEEVLDLFRSTDAGESWQRSGSLPQGAGLAAFGPLAAADPANPLAILATTREGILRSDDGGETFTNVTERPFLSEVPLALLLSPAEPGTLYATSSGLYPVGSGRQEIRLGGRQTFLRNLFGEKQVAPGSIVSIYGTDLASETHLAASTPLPSSLGRASVLFNGMAAPLFFVSQDQINAQVPFGLVPETGAFLPTTPVIMEVRRADGTSDRQVVGLLPKAAAILTENATRQSPPLLFHQSDFRRVTAEEPARRNEVITLLAVGLGDLSPSIEAGLPAPPARLPNVPCVVFSARPDSVPFAAAPALSAGAAPGLIGVYQVTLAIPASLNPGTYTLSLTDHHLSDEFSRECRVGYQGDGLDSVTVEVQ
jgi:uncharacterized protein (TIGR03437 family)